MGGAAGTPAAFLTGAGNLCVPCGEGIPAGASRFPNLAGCLPVQWDFGTVLSEYKKSPGILPTFLVGFIALGRLQHNFCHFSGDVKQKIFYYIKFFNAKFSCIR